MALTKQQKNLREQAQKRSKSSAKGWDSRRSKLKSPGSTGSELKSSNYGITTQQAISNRNITEDLATSTAKVLQRMRVKFLGSEIPMEGKQTKQTNPSSSSELIQAQDRAYENLMLCLSMIGELDKLQEEML